MRRKRIVLFLIALAIILTIPAVILAVTKQEEPPEYVVIGNEVRQVSKGKTKEDYIKEKVFTNSVSNTNELTVSELNDDTNATTETKVDEKYVSLEQKLINLAEKYDKREEYEMLKSEIEKEGTIGIVTDNHKKVCEIFMNLYEKENLTVDEKQSVKDFLEMILFNKIDKELENRIRNLIY